ncbi:MAG: Vms1/Ankzf1 family peptidyl-tRNA hydrolase [Methanosarcinales archaeon]
MFDKILGKRNLTEKLREKEEIIARLKLENKELKLENKKLQIKIQKETNRAKKATSDCQNAREELNKVLHKIQTLESELNKNKDIGSDLEFKEVKRLERAEILNIIHKLESVESKWNSLITIYLSPSKTLEDLQNDLNPFSSKKDINRGADYIAEDLKNNLEKLQSFLIKIGKTETGKVIFFDKQGLIECIVVPPLPILIDELHLDKKFKIGYLYDLYKKSMKIGVILLRSGQSALCIIEDSKLVHSKIVKSSVKSKHTKGGWSQRRFERIREEQITKHVDKFEEYLEQALEPYEKELDFIVIDGEPNLITTLEEKYRFKTPVLKKKLNIGGTIDKEILGTVAKKVWITVLYLI